MMNRSRRSGTSLVELLVVIVIFLIGILGIVQLFPAGFTALQTTRNNSVATELARAQIEAMKGRADQLPDRILPVRYVHNGTFSAIEVDYRRSNKDFGPYGVAIDQNGIVLDASSNALGDWTRLTGANVMQRIVGEGGRVPAPRAVGSFVGGLMVLQFAPIRFVNNDITLSVYGNDLVRRFGQPGFGSLNRLWEYYVSDENGLGNTQDTLFLPIVGAVGAKPYRIGFTFYVNDGGVFRQKVVLEFNDTTGFIPSTAYPGYWEVDIATLVGNLGLLVGAEAYVGLDEESVEVQRTYNRLNLVDVFSTTDPYEYKLLDANMGVLLFNPIAYDRLEPRPGNQRIPMKARADYDVYDWRILREEFRLPIQEPFQQKLIMNGLKVKGNVYTDGRVYDGLGVAIPDGAGTTQNVDLVLLDVETGGVYLHSPSNPGNPTPPPGTVNDYMSVDPNLTSYMADKSLGLVRFADVDPGTAGLQLRLIPPGATLPVTVNASNRKVRALYMARNEWAVQVLKAPSRYSVTFGEPVTASYYVGTSSAFGGQPTRIYFPGSDVGKQVTIGEIWYTNAGGLQVIRDQGFVITNSPADPLGLPYIDIRSVDQGAVAVDFSNGYAVRRVKGTSVTARTLWNPDFMRFGGDNTENLRIFERWARGWRTSTVDTYLEKAEN